MNGERGRHVEFWLFIAASLSFSSGPLSLIPHFGCPRLLTNEQTPPIEQPVTSPSSRFLPLCYTTNVTLPPPKTFRSDKPTSNWYHLPLPLHFFPACQCFTKHYDPLHSITLYLLISAPFLPPPPSFDPFPTLGAGLSPASIFYFTHPDFLAQRRILLTFLATLFLATRCGPEHHVNLLSFPLFPSAHDVVKSYVQLAIVHLACPRPW